MLVPRHCYRPHVNLVCEREGTTFASACLPDAAPGWVHPSAKAIEMDLEIAALMDEVVFGVAPAYCCTTGALWDACRATLGGTSTPGIKVRDAFSIVGDLGRVLNRAGNQFKVLRAFSVLDRITSL